LHLWKKILKFTRKRAKRPSKAESKRIRKETEREHVEGIRNSSNDPDQCELDIFARNQEGANEEVEKEKLRQAKRKKRLDKAIKRKEDEIDRMIEADQKTMEDMREWKRKMDNFFDSMRRDLEETQMYLDETRSRLVMTGARPNPDKNYTINNMDTASDHLNNDENLHVQRFILEDNKENMHRLIRMSDTPDG
jgi:hypothetical protein